nr:serine protein kinase PrkA [uncultured Desulfobacter sp.]
MTMDTNTSSVDSDAVESVTQALDFLNRNIQDYQRHKPVSFQEFLQLLNANPSRILRNIFQSFHDMIKLHVTEIENDIDSSAITKYDTGTLFMEGSDTPYFPDMLFANRFVKQMDYLRHGNQQNRIYVFYGPHGCGKSTFLNNLLEKFEQYANTEEGLRYEVVWRLDVKTLKGREPSLMSLSSFEKLIQYIDSESTAIKPGTKQKKVELEGPEPEFIEIPCLCHDNPFLVIPKEQRRAVLDELIKNDEFKWKLFTEKQYEWVFKDEVCTVCTSIYQSLLERLGTPAKVFEMLYARPYYFNRRLGNGISVFNPGDRPLRRNVILNQMLQSRINELFRDSNVINYIYSSYAKIHNGIYALMDIKSHNVERMVELHNIISEAIHKVENVEEHVEALFFALMNPEDKENIKDFPSFKDRIQYIDIPYVLDLTTEVKIYLTIFGRHIESSFLPMVLENFARVIICTRIGKKSPALEQWIKDPKKYLNFCDESLILLLMEIFRGSIPKWLNDEDKKALDKKAMKKIIAESEEYGKQGLSGRDSIKLFDRFYSRFAKEGRHINMLDLCSFFNKLEDPTRQMIPSGFLSSLLRMYDYCILQQVKECLYYYNEEQIAKDIKNYISAVTNEIGAVVNCIFTKEEIHVTETFLETIEIRLLSESADAKRRQDLRLDVLKEYTGFTLSHEIMIEGKDITQTRLFKKLHERYVHNLKKQVLEPFIDNANFRRAIKDFDTENFKAHDKRIKRDVKFLIDNLVSKFEYSQQGANEICIYVIDNDLANKLKGT